MFLEDFDYNLPSNLIATQPSFPRDEARLLTYNHQEFLQYQVKDLGKLLRKGDLLILNDTKVLNAKLTSEISGRNLDFDIYKISGNGKVFAFTKDSKKLSLGQEIIFQGDLKATIISKNLGSIELAFSNFTGDFIDKIHSSGNAPLPPYIYKKVGYRIEDLTNYQTIYAKNMGSVASPTAGLHFTKKLIEELENKLVNIAYVTLRVGAGTFLPVKSEKISDHIMHPEYGSLSKEVVQMINNTKKSGGRIIGVGSTTTRLLEAIYKKYDELREFSGPINIFITPGFKFEVIDLLMTNFHIPKSTLLMLVSAFIGHEKCLKLYNYAIKENFRFYSYGDSCLLYKKSDNVKL